MPAWTLKGHDALLAADIGGTNMRVGIVRTNLQKAADFAKADVWKSRLWRHADDAPTRDKAVESLVRTLKELIARANREKLALAPFVGVGLPWRDQA